MLRAALSNAIYQVPEMLPVGGWGQHDEIEDELDRFVDCFMQKLSEPVPQMERFIRGSQVRKDLCENAVGAPLNNLRYSYGPWISVKTAQRIFEQEVYDFGRSIGLSKQQAVGHVIKARECTSKYDIDMPELGDYESSECEDILNYLDTHSEQLLAKSNSEGAKQVKCYLQTLEVNDRRKYDWILLQLEFLGDEPLLDSVDFLREGIANMEAVDKAEEEKAAREDAKKVHTAQLQAQKEVSRHAEKKHNHKDNEHQAGRPGKQKHLTNNSEHAPNVQPFEDQDKPMKQKKKGKKRKSEPEPSVRSEAPSEENQRHRKIRVDRVAQEANCKKTSRKRITGPQHSPFFQRGSDHRAKKKDGVKKAELQVGFQPPMIP